MTTPFRPLLAVLTLAFIPARSPAEEVVNFWGIASSSSGTRDMKEWMPKVADAGAGIVRGWPEWGQVETKKGQWNWSSADNILEAARASNLQVNGILMGATPGSKGGSHAFPMDDPEGWSEYVRQCVTHSRGTVRYWEVWNEGNAGFNDGKHSTADYARLAVITYAAAKKADPKTQIALTTASFDPAYLGRAAAAQKAAGGSAAFDFLCVHPYELADNIGHPGGEVPFLWMSRLMRDTLQKAAPEKVDVPLWITEIGRNIAHRKDQPAAEREAASALVKIYTLSAAQGIRCVQWFEGRDPAGEEPGFGLMRRDGSPRKTLSAFQKLSSALGAAPSCSGWLSLNGTYGFVFRTAAGPALIIWNDAGMPEQQVRFSAPVEWSAVMDDIRQKSAEVRITGDPLIVRNLPSALVAEAEANAANPWPWGGNFAAAKSVSAVPGNDDVSAGVIQCGARTQPRITFPDGSGGILLGANESVRFCVHPSFASIHQQEYHVRVTVRRVTPGNVGMNLLYEIADTQGRSPVRNAGTWFGLNDSKEWQSFTWHVKDACFAKMWGYDIAFVPEQSQPFVIGKVEVSTEAFAK